MFTVFLEILHDTLGFFMRSTVAFIVMACLVCHHHNTLLDQSIKALLQRGVHIGNSGGEPLGIETENCLLPFPTPLRNLYSLLSLILSMSIKI